MTVRDELERAIQAQQHYERTGVMPSWVKHALTDFLRDHGPALLAMVEDSERYRWLRSCHEAEIGERHATVVMWTDEPWEPEDGHILDAAIDKARAGK